MDTYTSNKHTHIHRNDKRQAQGSGYLWVGGKEVGSGGRVQGAWTPDTTATCGVWCLHLGGDLGAPFPPSFWRVQYVS